MKALKWGLASHRVNEFWLGDIEFGGISQWARESPDTSKAFDAFYKEQVHAINNVDAAAADPSGKGKTELAQLIPSSSRRNWVRAQMHCKMCDRFCVFQWFALCLFELLLAVNSFWSKSSFIVVSCEL
jgi:hypothetical protein